MQLTAGATVYQLESERKSAVTFLLGETLQQHDTAFNLPLLKAGNADKLAADEGCLSFFILIFDRTDDYLTGECLLAIGR